ncbi:hypothetical protein K1T71_007620 [Dendrolimus kikuchii]|uniref:Uncharacterized protein n=1 Tax=Dendrolimus kikuchii TaxID=765133 RepID=A0ACC1CXW9_9NEOP|nr:hypothetical protein K1T71_007620 [Dendrolimus kikuchii]
MEIPNANIHIQPSEYMPRWLLLHITLINKSAYSYMGTCGVFIRIICVNHNCNRK